jgi:glycosyltransferase involved in cell wall biosynthesis
MRILINALFLIPNRVGGSETYLRGLVRGLADADRENEYILCLGPAAAPTFEAPNARWRIMASPARSEWRPGRLLLEQVWLPRIAGALRADVIHSAGYTAPLVSGGARVTNIHDMNYKRHPEDLSFAERAVYAALIPRVARRSHRVLALTQSARADILRWTGAANSKVTVVQPGTRSSWPGDPAQDVERLAAIGIRGPFIVSVATAYPHKNLARLVAAFPLRRQSGAAVKLVVVGLKGRATPAIEAAAARQHGDLIEVLGWVDDALLASLYRCSLGLAFPSLYEGFGLPIVEAMALGTPVLTSDVGAMAEVAGGAAELVDPYDVESIRAGLEGLAFDESRRIELRRLGRARAAEFTWRHAAEATMAIYSEAAADAA